METIYTAGRGTPADFSDYKITSLRRTSSAKCSATTLRFVPLTLAELPLVNRILQQSPSRTCDYSIGGIYMWIEYFGYKVCFVGDTIFIKGVSESDPTVTTFMMPVGEMDDARAVLPDGLRLENALDDTDAEPLRLSPVSVKFYRTCPQQRRNKEDMP